MLTTERELSLDQAAALLMTFLRQADPTVTDVTYSYPNTAECHDTKFIVIRKTR